MRRALPFPAQGLSNVPGPLDPFGQSVRSGGGAADAVAEGVAAGGGALDAAGAADAEGAVLVSAFLSSQAGSARRRGTIKRR